MKDNPKWIRDKDGPNGFLRLWIKTADKVSMYEDIGKERSLNSTERMGKNVSDETLASRTRVMLSGGVGRGPTLPGEIGTELLAKASGTTLFDGSLVEPEIADILEKSNKKRKVVQEELEEVKGETEDEAGEGAGDENDEAKRGKAAWFDSETKVNAALRKYEKSTQKLRASLESTMTRMIESLAEIKDESEKLRVKPEMAVVSRRCAWLDAVLKLDNGDALRAMKESTQAAIRAAEVAAANDTVSSSTTTAMMQTGPCAGYENLTVLQVIEQHKITLKSANRRKTSSLESAARMSARSFWGS